MALNVWTKPSGYNFASEPNAGQIVLPGNFIVGQKYVIVSGGLINGTSGTTDFKKIGARSNLPGTVFTATNSGSAAGPTTQQNDVILFTPGNGVASEVALPERSQLNLQLPVEDGLGVTYEIISGKLPNGLILKESKIVGSAFEVPQITEFKFCIRASKDNEVSDRTFSITITGPDAPEFLTPPGDLPIGTNEQYFVLDSSFVDYQIEAFDYDTAAGQRLSYFIADDNGELPPGLILTTDGRIVGFVQPILTIKPADGTGFYDIGYFDSVAYDWGYRPSNGMDSFLYDTTIFDYSLAERGPRKLNRNYEFVVSVTDGDSIAKRKFKIFVVSDDYFRADNTRWLNGFGLFTADVTYLRAPIWVTASYLGSYRANNYITLLIDTYDTNNVVYRLNLVNADVVATSSKIAELDNVLGSNSLTIKNTSKIPAIGQFLTFNALFNGGTEKIYEIGAVTNLGNNQYRLTLLSPLDTIVPNNIEFFIGTKSILPPGMEFDIVTAEVYGAVPYQNAITKPYNFTITATRLDFKEEKAYSYRTFTIDIIGEIDSVMIWNTDPNLGSINANYISTLHVKASSTIPKAVITYRLISGSLPSGLQLLYDGEIIGKVEQFGDNIEYQSFWKQNRPYQLNDVVGYNELYYKRILPYNNQQPEVTFEFEKWEPYTFINLGLTSFSDRENGINYSNQSLDDASTTIDRAFTFTVEASDQYRLAVITRTFIVRVETPNQLLFSNIRTKPYMNFEQRDIWYDFIHNSGVFTPSSIYRPGDPNFGLRTDLSMIIFAGIETTEAAAYVGAIGLNHKRKRFHFGSVKKAIAYLPGTKTPLYEVVYVQMLDPLEPNKKRLPTKLLSSSKQPQPITVDNSTEIWRNSNSTAPNAPRPEPYMTIDSTGYMISDPNYRTYFPNSISIWRERIRTVGFRERNYLPLWMRSIQPGQRQELDFTLAVPLCYCKPGAADDVLLNIKYSNFDFTVLDYTVDRYIIDSVDGSTTDKYLVFRNDRITV